MPTLAGLSSKPLIREYAQGAAQSAAQPIAGFVAPDVSVGNSNGRYKVYTAKSRFRIPETLRGYGGRATVLDFDASDETYDCQPHSIDVPVDIQAEGSQEDINAALMEAADEAAAVGSLSHEKRVVDLVQDTLTAVSKDWGANADPVDDIDDQILAVLKAAKYGSLMGVRILFGADAFKVFKNHPAVAKKFVVGTGKGSQGVSLAQPTIDAAGELFIGRPESRISAMVYDDAPEGKDEDIEFILSNQILVFATLDSPTRRDPSFMKTFRLRNRWMQPGSYQRDDGRVEMAKFDWSADVKVTNSSAGKLIELA